MLNLALIFFGVMGLQRLPVRELPDIDPSVVNILTVYPGANAEVVETEVTERLEEAISSADSIKLITSTSREQVSSIAVEFTQGRDVDLAAQDIRDRVARVRGELPEGIDEPVISKQDSGARPIMWVAFFSDRHDVSELSRIAETMVKDRLQTVPGVSSVILGGEKKRAIRIWLDPLKMASRQITALDVENTLLLQNIELPSGRVENMEREFTIKTQGELKTASDFNNLILRRDESGVVRLSDVGTAEMGVEDMRAVARFNSKPAIGLGIVRQSKSNTLTVAEGIKKKMHEIAPMLPDGVQFQFPYDESVYIGHAVREVWITLAMAFVLVVLTIFMFLRNIRSTLVPSLAIPVSVTATFGVLYVLGLTVNIFTLLALVLAIGIVVDDAIVVLENIYRHIEEGEKPFYAAINAIKEITFPVIATTLSLVAVFIPLAFIGGITGRLLLEFAVALSVAVIISSVVALTLAPMTAARVLRPIGDIRHGRIYNWLERRFDWINSHYERGLQWSMDNRAKVIIIAILSIVASYFLFTRLDREFLPNEDKGRLLTMAIAPDGASPEYTDRMMRQIETVLKETPAVNTYFSAVAIPFEGPGDAAMGFAFVRLHDDNRPHVRDAVGGPAGIGARLFGEVEGAIGVPIMPKAVDIGFEQPYQLVIKHQDLDELNEFTQAFTGRLMQEGFVSSARSAFTMSKPELHVEIDRGRAADLGVSVRDISRTLQILFGGDDISDIKLDGKQYEVIAQLKRNERLVPSDLDRLFVRGNNGNLVQLSNVITTSETAGPTMINRHARERAAIIEATPAGVTLGSAVERTESLLGEMLPKGFTFEWDGEAKDLEESSADIYGFMVLAIIVVYMVLGAQFESFVSPFVVMLALPLAFLGAFGLLYILSAVDNLGTMLYGWAHFSPDPPGFVHVLSSFVPRIPAMNINIFSQVGLILLIGLVTKNSILLVEFANLQMSRGLDSKAAMLKAGLIRLRPILMTSMATIAGILPIAIGFGAAAESRRPMGVVAVGGMITSTILTLFVIPVIYTLLADLEGRKSRREEK